jgi:hypothetical protein
MDDRLQRRIQRYGWDRSADQYEGYWRRQLEPAQAHAEYLASIEPFRSDEGYRMPGEFVVVRGVKE